MGRFATIAGARRGLALGSIAALIATLIGVLNLRHAHSKAENSVG